MKYGIENYKNADDVVFLVIIQEVATGFSLTT